MIFRDGHVEGFNEGGEREGIEGRKLLIFHLDLGLVVPPSKMGYSRGGRTFLFVYVSDPYENRYCTFFISLSFSLVPRQE